MIYIENKKRKIERIQDEYPTAIILDITSTSNANYAKWLSPFFPHNNIVSSNFASADFRKMRTDSFQKSRTTRFRKIRVVR